jgi:hypothetical protein
MAWGLIRVALFAAAFLVGLMFTGSGHTESASSPVLNEETGASLLVACKGGEVVVAPLQARADAIQLHCVQTKMVVVRDYTPIPENIPHFSRIHTLVQ